MDLTFGDRVRILREESGINQTELGKQVHMTQRKISYIECNKYEPGIDDIKALCLFFGVSADYFLGLPQNLNRPDM